MKLKTILLLLFLSTWFYGFAQDANAVLNEAVDKIQKSSGVEAKFFLSVEGQGINGSTQGVIQLNKNQFRVETPEITAWFDGKTQWNYVKSNDEVNISTPTQEELNSINPYSLLSLHKNGYAASLGSQKQYRGTDIYEIVLSAKQEQAMQKVIIYLRKDSLEPTYIRVAQKDGVSNEIRIEHLTTDLKLKSNHFKFNEKEYPSAEIIDLR